jgi:hypothetical protein
MILLTAVSRLARRVEIQFQSLFIFVGSLRLVHVFLSLEKLLQGAVQYYNYYTTAAV